MKLRELPGKPLSKKDQEKFYRGLERARLERDRENYPPSGKSYAKLLDCPREECAGHIVKETEVSYPNPEGRMGGPRLSPHYAHRAYCNGCAQSYAVDILERLLAKPAPQS